MADLTLKDARERLKKKWLGKHGIHGVGLSRAENAIKLYVGPDSEIDSSELWLRIEKEAAPFRVIVVREEQPFLG
jgi:hypothetical protein